MTPPEAAPMREDVTQELAALRKAHEAVLHAKEYGGGFPVLWAAINAIPAALDSLKPQSGLSSKALADRLHGHAKDLREAEWDEENAAAFDVEEAARRLAHTARPDAGDEVFPQSIGRVHLGETCSDGDRLCSHGHPVSVGHPLYWPERLGEYPDDVDPLCIEHAIEQAVDDNSYPDAGDEVERLKHVIDRDRYIAAAALNAIEVVTRGRSWLSESGRGSYAYDDERYQAEFGLALAEIDRALLPLRKLVMDKSDCTTDPEKVQGCRDAAAAMREGVDRGMVERLENALNTVVSDCQLAIDALGNSPAQFDSVKGGIAIIRDRAAAALSRKGG